MLRLGSHVLANWITSNSQALSLKMPGLLPSLLLPAFMVHPLVNPMCGAMAPNCGPIQVTSPHRPLACGNLSASQAPLPPKLEFMEVAALPSGISNGTVTAGVLAGRLGSSTRLAVGLAALAKPFPVHFGTESRAFSDKANLILAAPELWPGAPMTCKGMATFGSSSMKG